MLEPRRFTTVAFASLLGWAGCQGQLFTLAVEESAVTTVPAATPLEVLIGDVGLGEFVAFDITQATELQNQGVGPGDIMNVSFTLFELEALTGAADLSFLESMEVYVESEGLQLPREPKPARRGLTTAQLVPQLHTPRGLGIRRKSSRPPACRPPTR